MNKTTENATNDKKRIRFRFPSIKDILLAILAAVLCGMGVGFVNYSSLGMDAIGILYDGIRNVLHLSPAQIGYASYIVCFVLSVFLWFAARKYVSFGSLIYIVFYGMSANLGTSLWEYINPKEGIVTAILIALLGLLILYSGLAIFITINIGVDVFTGIVLWICDITGRTMPIVKALFDLILVIIGFLLGGSLGVLTPVTVLFGGQCISLLMKVFARIYKKKDKPDESGESKETDEPAENKES